MQFLILEICFNFVPFWLNHWYEWRQSKWEKSISPPLTTPPLPCCSNSPSLSLQPWASAQKWTDVGTCVVGSTYAHISPSPSPLSVFYGSQSRSQWGVIRDAVTKYCLSPQDTRSVRGIVTSYIKWLHQTICCMTAHLRHNIIQRDRGGREQGGGGALVYRGGCFDHFSVSSLNW